MNAADGARARELLTSPTPADQELVLEFAREAPLLYGPWRHLKALYKAAETDGSPAVLGALAGRFDRVWPESLRADTPASQSPTWELTEGHELAVEGSVGVLTRRHGFTVVDLSAPTSPRVVATDAPGVCRRVLMSGGRAYVEVEGRRGEAARVLILDLSNPSSPQAVGTVQVGSLRGMALLGNCLLFLEDLGRGRGLLRVVDVSSPSQPVSVSQIELPEAGAMSLVGSRVYVSPYAPTSNPGVRVVDLTYPGQPRLLGFWRASGLTMLAGETLLPGLTRGRWLYIIDTEAPLQQEPVPPPPPQVERRGLMDRMFGVLRKAAEEVVTDVAGTLFPEIPHSALEMTQPGVGRCLVHRGFAYITHGHSGMEVVELGPSPRSLGDRPIHGSPLLALVGDQLVALPLWGQPQVFDLSNPAHPVRTGVPPSPATLDYMKRRARRCLRRLAETDPARFVETAFHTLAEGGASLETLDPEENWVSYDLLYGGSDRYEQARHGRGAYAERCSGFRRRVREERCPAAWDARPDLARELLRRPDLPWQTHETMLKMLRLQHQALPELSVQHFARFLRSPSPLLRSEGARGAAAELEAGSLDGETAARAFFFSSGAVRARVAPRLQGRSGSPSWARPFTETLLRLLGEHLGEGLASRRVISSAGLLTRAFGPFLTSAQLLPLADRLLRGGDPELTELALAGLQTVTPDTLGPWLRIWNELPSGTRESAWQALITRFRRATLSAAEVQALVADRDSTVRWVTWFLLLAVEAPAAVVNEAWDWLLAQGPDTEALRTVLSSPAALELLRRSRADLDALARRLVTVPSLGALISPESVAPLASALPATALLSLIAALPEDRWRQLALALLRGARESGRLAATWREAPGAAQPARTRLLEDGEWVAAFMELQDPSLLEISDPAFEPLLLHWLTLHGGLLQPGSPELLLAATHPLPSVRNSGLESARGFPLGLSFALRLVESGVPAAVELGWTYFASPPPGEEAVSLLALADSPDRPVRELSRELITERPPEGETLAALSEHGDPEMNRFLAEVLNGPQAVSVPQEALQEFDRGVLRARNRGRRAKENVKSRLSGKDAPDTRLLLELARSGTPRDAEWALAELARLAVTGEDVPGLQVEGIAGV